MKKIYQRPSVKIKKIETEGPLATSPGVGGNTGIGHGEGEPPAITSAKGNSLIDSEEDDASSANIWDK